MTRDELIAAMRATAAQRPRAVQTKAWGTVYVREVTVADVDEDAREPGAKGDKRRLARGAAKVICDESGKLLFDPQNVDDVELLASQPWSLLREVVADPEPESAKKN